MDGMGGMGRAGRRKQVDNSGHYKVLVRPASLFEVEIADLFRGCPAMFTCAVACAID